MEEKRDKCRVGGVVYSSGDKVCDNEYCYVCRAGEWELSFGSFIGVGP